MHLIPAHICPKLGVLRNDVSFPGHLLGVQVAPKIGLSNSQLVSDCTLSGIKTYTNGRWGTKQELDNTDAHWQDGGD